MISGVLVWWVSWVKDRRKSRPHSRSKGWLRPTIWKQMGRPQSATLQSHSGNFDGALPNYRPTKLKHYFVKTCKEITGVE
jgi:hypothetical protein